MSVSRDHKIRVIVGTLYKGMLRQDAILMVCKLRPKHRHQLYLDALRYLIRKRRVPVRLGIVALSLFVVGCGIEKGGSLIPTAPDVVSIDGPQRLLGTHSEPGVWNGTTTATGLGESGTLSANFTLGEGGTVNATLTWKSNVTSLTYHGTVTGTLGNLTVQATDAPGTCGYHGQGSLSQDGLTFSGTYSGTGSAHCNMKSGTFRLTRDAPPPPLDVCPNLEGNQATVPQGYQLVNGQCVIPPPPPPVCPTSYSYSGPSTFELSNSGDAAELAYVKANVSQLLSGPTKIEGNGVTWTATGNYGVVLVKSGTTYRLYTNVHTGDVLQSPGVNPQGKQQNISHVSVFNCVSVS